MIKHKKRTNDALMPFLRGCALIAAWLFHPLATASTYSYAIEKQPFIQALTQYAEQSNLQILFRPEVIPERDVEPLIGQYTPQEALDILLRNTPLQYTFGTQGVVVIRHTQQPSPALDAPADAAASDTHAMPSSAPQEELLVMGIQRSLRKNLQAKPTAIPSAPCAKSNGNFIGKFSGSLFLPS